jgi:GTP-binding protein
MLPVIAIIGRPNVGKSTLFNKVTKSRDALVADLPGLTRDRQYGEGTFQEQRFLVIDTGGIGEAETGIDELMLGQSQQAIKEADAVLFVMDARAGLTAGDEEIARRVRNINKPVYLIINKSENLDEEIVKADFYALGLGEPIAISAAHNGHIASMLETVLEPMIQALPEETGEDKGIQVAIIGRPNVGKSTLVNRILGEERVIVFDQAGTTRDSIFIPFERFGQKYTIIDTAGVRRRGKINETVEKFSVIKSLKAIESAHVVIYVIDAREGVVDHDLHLLGFVLDAGKALVLAINKWDGMDSETKVRVKSELERRLFFIDFAETHFISALHGTGVGHLFESIDEAYAAATKKFSTNYMTNLLSDAVVKNPPPMAGAQRIKLRYAHFGGHNPPTVIIHGNQTQDLPISYKRYLEKFFIKALELVGTPIRLQFKTGDNPYKDKKNILTKRQLNKKRRLKKYLKKKYK